MLIHVHKGLYTIKINYLYPAFSFNLTMFEVSQMYRTSVKTSAILINDEK